MSSRGRARVVFGSRVLGDEFPSQLAATFPDVEFVPAYDEASQLEVIGDAQAYVGSPSRSVFTKARSLRWIHFPGMGIDRIVAIKEIVDSNVVVTNAPGPHVIPMAEWVLATMLSLAHMLPEAARDQREARWDSRKFVGRIVELSGTSIGIYGLGLVGSAVAARAHCLGMNVRAVSRSFVQVPNCTIECMPPERLDDLMRESRWLVVSVPITNRTRHSINRERMGLMKPGSYIVAVTRSIVDEAALAHALASGHLAGAALDSTEVEPLPRESPLWSAPNLILTPHVSAVSPQLYEGRRQIFIENLQRFLRNDVLLTVCDKSSD